MIAHVLMVTLALGIAGLAHLAGERAGEAKNASSDPDALHYLPESQYLRMASLGHHNLMADLVWLRSIQYYGAQRLSGRNYDEAERLFQLIYDLDPSFQGATRFGAVVLAQDAEDPEGAIDLLHRAAVDHPEAWEYPFDEGFIYQTIVKDYGAAARAYQRAADRPGAPSIAVRLAGLSLARLGDRAAAREVWTALWNEADNDLMRQVAERNLKNIVLEEHQDALTEAVASFVRTSSRPPRDWNDLLSAGLIDEIPVEPFGGAYFYDPGTASVWSTTHVDRRMAHERDIFQGFVRQLHREQGSFPESLDAVVEGGLALSTPWEPFGLSLDYDPVSGTLSWNPPWPQVEPHKQGAGA